MIYHAVMRGCEKIITFEQDPNFIRPGGSRYRINPDGTTKKRCAEFRGCIVGNSVGQAPYGYCYRGETGFCLKDDQVNRA